MHTERDIEKIRPETETEPNIEITEPEIESWRQTEKHRDLRTDVGTRVNTGERWRKRNTVPTSGPNDC